MDLAKEVRQFGNTWTLTVNQHFETIFEPLHAERAPQYEGVVKEAQTVKYGSHDRHRLDIYAPASATAGSRLPVVIYFHGGGFTAGDNSISPSMHGNIGKFFASNGCIGVLATYRLLPGARFPDGAADIASALSWLATNIGEYGGDGARLFPVGQSAGGAHLAVALFMGLLRERDLLNKIRGVIFQSVPFWYNLKLERRRQNMVMYHGTESEEEIGDKMSVGLFEICTAEEMEHWPKLLFLIGEYDPDEIVNGNLLLVDKYRQKQRRMPLFEVMEGHNHISYALGLGLENEIVGPRLLAFISGN